MKTIITGIKKLKEGESVGYGHTFTAPADMTIATIPVGYFEGINRKLSYSNLSYSNMEIDASLSGNSDSSNKLDANHGVILVGEKRVPCPIIGRVSMNITSIDISKLNSSDRSPDFHNNVFNSNVKIGDEVVAISRNGADKNSIVNIAKKCGTISYEIVVHIPAHLKRVVIN
jgi:alanine racemase